MPKETQITAKAPKVDKEATIVVKCFGENLEEDIKLVGPDVIKSNYEANVIITIQGGIRRMLSAGSDAEAVQAAFADYKPGTAVRRGVDVKASFKAWFASLTPEEKKKELAALREAAG